MTLKNRGILERRSRTWLWERADEDGDGVEDGVVDGADDGNETEGEDEAGEEDGTGKPGRGPGPPSSKGPGKPPGPPGQSAKTTDAISTIFTPPEITTTSSSSKSATSTTSEESTTTSTTSSDSSTTTSTSSSESTTSTTSSSVVILTTNPPLPFSTLQPGLTSTLPVTSPPASFSLVSSPASLASLLPSSVPFSTLTPQQTSVTSTIAPLTLTSPPSSTLVQSSDNTNSLSTIPIPPAPISSSSSASASPTSMSAAHGISSENSEPTAAIIGIGVSIGVVTVLISGILLFFLRQRKKQQSYVTGRASATTSQSFWDRVSGLPTSTGEGPAPPPRASSYTQDFNSYTPFPPPPVHRQFDTSSSGDEITNMPPPALFIPPIMTNALPPPPPIFTNRPYQSTTQPSPLSLNPSQPYKITTTIRTGPLSLSWFLGKPSKIPRPSPNSPIFIEPTGYGSTSTSPSKNNEKQDMATRITQIEGEMTDREQRWESSRHGGLTEHPISSDFTPSHPNYNNRQTLQSEGWESGIGDSCASRFLSGIANSTSDHPSATVQNAHLDTIQPVTREQLMQYQMEIANENEKRKFTETRRAKWESSPDSLNELPRWRDPVLSIFEEVRGKTSQDYGDGAREGHVSPRRMG